MPTDPNINVQALTAEQNILASALLRPLSPNSMDTHHFDRDSELLKRLAAWMKNILLAGNRYSIGVDVDLVHQLPNLRPDCNGYVIRIHDTEILNKIVINGHRKTKRAADFLAEVSSKEIFYGSLYWFRHIKSNDKHKELAASDLVEEIYFLDVVYRVGDLATSRIRVHYNSIGMAWMFRNGWTMPQLDAALAPTPYFVDANTIILHWHDLAKRLGLLRNYFYLRACFGAAHVPRDVIAESPEGHAAVVFLHDGFDPGDNEPRNRYHERFGGVGAAPPVFNRGLPYNQQPTAFKTMRLTNVRFCNLTNVSGSDLGTIAQQHHPEAEVPRPAAFTRRRETNEFAFFVTNQFPGIRHEGDGYFSVPFEMTDPSAASGVRGSGWLVVAAQVAFATNIANPMTLVVVGGGGGGAWLGGAVGDVIVKNRRSDPERVENRKLLVAQAQLCAGTSKTEAECRECVEMTGRLQAEKDALAADKWIEVGSGLAGGAIGGCGAGALVGFLGGPAAPFTVAGGCAIGLVAGLVVAGGVALIDYLAEEDAINTLETEAFGPCDTVEMQF